MVTLQGIIINVMVAFIVNVGFAVDVDVICDAFIALTLCQ